MAAASYVLVKFSCLQSKLLIAYMQLHSQEIGSSMYSRKEMQLTMFKCILANRWQILVCSTSKYTEYAAHKLPQVFEMRQH